MKPLSLMRSLDLDRVRDIARLRHASFVEAAPFPHVVIDDLLHPEVAAALAAEFEVARGDWIFYHHVNERKRGFNDVPRMGPVSQQVIAELNGPEFLAVLGTLTGLPGLLADPALEGGGLSDVEPGGFVNVHSDFLSHPSERTWNRRLNLLIFLNRPWTEADGGRLELWDPEVTRPVQQIVPAFNRCVLFDTGAASFHSVTTVTCPAGRSRRALALYYFQDAGAPRPIRSTRYVPRPSDGATTRLLIRLDRWLLYGYAALKRYTPFGDRLVSRLLRRL